MYSGSGIFMYFILKCNNFVAVYKVSENEYSVIFTRIHTFFPLLDFNSEAEV